MDPCRSLDRRNCCLSPATCTFDPSTTFTGSEYIVSAQGKSSGVTKDSSLESVKNSRTLSQRAERSPSGSVNGLVHTSTRWAPVVDPQRLIHGKSERTEGLEMG